jgi:hypothetical protein
MDDDADIVVDVGLVNQVLSYYHVRAICWYSLSVSRVRRVSFMPSIR